MPKLVRSQKKGKKSSYTSRFCSGAIKASANIPLAIEDRYTLTEFKKDNLSRVIGVFTDAKKEYDLFLTVPNGVKVGAKLATKDFAFLPLKNYEPGTELCNVELLVGGKRIACSSGSKAVVFKQEIDTTTVILPSKLKLELNNNCRAMKGSVCNSQLTVKDWQKAGKKFYAMKAKGKKYPEVSANKMNVIDHCLGGSRRKARGRPMTVSRNKSPGAKYGCIAARRTGTKN